MSSRKKWDTNNGDNLTVKERQFVELYCHGDFNVRGNGSECIRAVYGQGELKDASIHQYSWEMMRKPKIELAIVNELKSINKNWVITRLQQESTSKDNKAADRVRATELIGKTMGIFIDKVENNIKMDGLFVEEDEKTKDTTPYPL